MKDLWFIGDAFLQENFYGLSKMKSEAHLQKRAIPYVYDFYNVSCYTAKPDSAIKVVLTRIVNSFVKALNDTLRVPSVVLMMIDDDILKEISASHDDHGIKVIIKGALTWILNQISRAVEAKIDFLERRKPGAVTANEPKIIWTSMMNRMRGRSRVLAHRSKYNDVLIEVLAQRKNHFIIDINENMADISFFDAKNKLNSYGRHNFWIQIDTQLEKFDKGAVTLTPVMDDDDYITQQKTTDENTAKVKHFTKKKKFFRKNWMGSRQYWRKKKFFRKNRMNNFSQY